MPQWITVQISARISVTDLFCIVSNRRATSSLKPFVALKKKALYNAGEDNISSFLTGTILVVSEGVSWNEVEETRSNK